MSLEIDYLLQDRYRMIKELAQSGMGTIYLARDEVVRIGVVICDALMYMHSRKPPIDLPGRDIFVMLCTGARLTRLTENSADDYQAAWRP